MPGGWPLSVDHDGPRIRHVLLHGAFGGGSDAKDSVVGVLGQVNYASVALAGWRVRRLTLELLLFFELKLETVVLVH